MPCSTASGSASGQTARMTGLSAGERVQVLIVVAELDEMAALDLAAVRLLIAQQHAQQRRLAAAVWPHDAQALAAMQREARDP